MRPIDVVVEVAELNEDVGATATVALSWGVSVLTADVAVPAGGRVLVPFNGIALATPAAVELTATIDDASPVETGKADNVGTTTVEVTEHELAASRLVLDSFGGTGLQFNHHVFAPITPAPPGSLPALEEKVRALKPEFVRIFFNEAHEKDANNMASFVRTVELAHQTGATINITYQTAVNAKLNPPVYMNQFAAVLDDLVRARRLTGVRWVTIQNEVNDTNVTPDEYEQLNRALHAELVTRGLRAQIRFMVGDLVEQGRGGGQRFWFQEIARRMPDLIDAWSTHIYWSYWDLPRMEKRLREVRKIVTEELPENARKPLYVTEFGVRGAETFTGKPRLLGGYWQDGTQMVRTNIAAFQQFLFTIEAAQLGYAGVAKWDAYWGRYDTGAQQAYYLIGPASEGWPLFPSYHALRLVFQTAERGWRVLGIDPWVDDDWKLDDQRRSTETPEKELTAYAGPNGELTLMGADTNARGLNAASGETRSYSIGGLPASTTFTLAVWNPTANGENAIAATVTTNAAGVARFDVPLHAAFALTTVSIG